MNLFERGINRVESFNYPTGKGELELTNCGYEKCIPNFMCPPHVKSSFIIHYVIKGNGFFTQNNNKYPIGPGELFAIYSGYIVSYYVTDPEDPWIFCWFGFTGSRALELLEQVGFSLQNPVIKLLKAEEFLSIIKICADNIKSQHTVSNILLQSYLYRIFYILEDCYDKKNVKPYKLDSSDQLFKNASAFIAYNYMKQISVSDIIKHMKIDRTYNWKIFHQHANKSPQQYLMEYRIEKAVELIKSTSLQLTEIAICVGIPDLYYFSRLFKKIKGIPPSKYPR